MSTIIPFGCDYWTGARYCEESTRYTDEVSDLVFCPAHAGPLAWQAYDINLYSLALLVSAEFDVLYEMPAELQARLYPVDRAAA